MINIIIIEERTIIQTAAYTIYSELVKTKPISQREFHQKFKDNWDFSETQLRENIARKSKGYIYNNA